MCGIVGYVGGRECQTILMDGLRRLEYRGYDSAGVAIINGSGIHVTKKAGKISALEEILKEHPLAGTTGIAHTRWATHGAPTTTNAHPHTDGSGEIALVHNGIVENYRTLKSKLQSEGHVFETETDTEVLAHLVEKYYQGNLEEAVADALALVEGTYGIAVVSEREPNKIVGARHGSPLVVGVGDGEYWVASDVSAILRYTKNVVYLDDGEMVVITPDSFQTITLDGRGVTKQVQEVEWELEQIEKGGFAALHAQGDLRAAPVGAERVPRAAPPRRGDGASRRAQHGEERAPTDRPHHHHRLRHLVARRHDRRVRHRGIRRHPGRGRVRLRVPLSQPDHQGGHRLLRDLPVR